MECQQYRYILAIVEYAGASLVCATPLYSRGGHGLQPIVCIVDCVLHQCIFPRVFGKKSIVARLCLAFAHQFSLCPSLTGERSIEDLQNLGIYGHDGPDTALLSVTLHGSALRTALGQYRGLGIDHTRPTTVHYDVLSRLCRHTFQRSYSKCCTVVCHRHSHSINWK